MTQVAGGIQIRRVGTGKTPAEAAYSVMFVPDPRGVGALSDRRIEGEDGLRGFLRRVGIHGRLIEEAVGALRQAPAHQTTHVLLTPAQIKQLRLKSTRQAGCTYSIYCSYLTLAGRRATIRRRFFPMLAATVHARAFDGR